VRSRPSPDQNPPSKEGLGKTDAKNAQEMLMGPRSEERLPAVGIHPGNAASNGAEPLVTETRVQEPASTQDSSCVHMGRNCHLTHNGATRNTSKRNAPKVGILKEPSFLAMDPLTKPICKDCHCDCTNDELHTPPAKRVIKLPLMHKCWSKRDELATITGRKLVKRTTQTLYNKYLRCLYCQTMPTFHFP
jgi:hypothetical protein